MQNNQNLLPIEIKSGQTIASDWFKNLKKWQNLNEKSKQQRLIYGGDKNYIRNDVACQSWKSMEVLHYLKRRWRKLQ